ncbi:hypothetical protein D9758_015816 [Tetrapyrgos nigripes]|uniref:CHAT domain-containing protein n=1 Tax=Tetrapyrgos nigripes TaxID=182062 RepID=A0A8H5CGU6_9AGAR|nr:hypothetical protein D9758_015816 [Tetrapyrgos nigripes]
MDSAPSRMTFPLGQQAVDITPDGHASKASRLNNLGIAFQSRFERLGELGDIENAIQFQQQAVDITPDGHASKASRLNNLGIAFQSRFERLGELGDIENAIQFQQQAVDITPDGHASKASQLNNLGIAFQSRFERLGELGDIENAIQFQQQAVDITPDGHASKASWLNNLGTAFQKFEHLRELGDIENAISTYRQSTKNTSSPPSNQYRTAHQWATLSLTCQGSFLALDAFTVVLDTIPQLVWLGQTVHQQYEELPKIGQTINEAIATAISVGNLTQAVEWLEEGHSIVWGQILQLRSPLDDLHDQDPQLADDLERVSKAFHNARTSTRSNFIDNPTTHLAMTGKQEAQKFDGFDSFLRPKKLSALTPPAANGTIIMINIGQSHCDALVLSASSDIIHVTLPNFSSQQAKEMYSQLVSFLKQYHARDRKPYPNPLPNHESETFSIGLRGILRVLWVRVVEPVLSKIGMLNKNTSRDSLPHITWCATGLLAFLPLHAAGLYDSTETANTSNYVVSSYTTTLTAMLGSAPKCMQYPTENPSPSVLIVTQPNTPGMTALPGTEREAETIQKYTSPERTRLLTHEAATIKNVTNEMSKYNVVHLACHGIQDSKNPLDSAFILHDGRLKLQDLMSLSLERPELAFLSACQTATGDEKLPEEAVHLAAGMLAVGYPSVIATMWSVGDNDAPLIADKVYESLLRRNESAIQNPRLTPA